jgi:hypothetical protein
MSKYIIEIEEKPLCVFDKDTQTYFPRLWRVKGFNSLVFDEEGLSRLEELNSDYINEHFGDLQDTAYKTKCGYCNEYQRGFEDGKKTPSELASNAEYQRGLNDAWECGKKLAWTAKYGGYGERLSDVFGRDDTFDFYDYTPNEAIEKLKAFEQKQDKIEVGDELTAYSGVKCIATVADYENDIFYVLFSDGSSGKRDVKTLKKTGRHFDIQKILEEMRND